MDIHALFENAERDGRVGIARKSQPVDARPAVPGEVVVTIIADEGKETQSRPPTAGDMVVRNRCEATGNEEYLVSAGTFAERYEGPLGPEDAHGWQAYRPRGTDNALRGPPDGGRLILVHRSLGRGDGGEAGRCYRPQPRRPHDTYRVAAASFECTYEILEPPRMSR